MKKIIQIVFILFFTISMNLYAQKKDIVIVEGTAQVEYPDYKSLDEVKREAEELAKINALEKAFGIIIIQGNSTYVSNINTGEKTETKSEFTMIGNTFVKGEILEITEESFKEIIGYKNIDGKEYPIKEIQCTIKAKAIELTEPKIEFEVYTLSGKDKRLKTTSFKSNDTLYFYFKSPVSGYLSIFLDDNKYSQCLLPYKSFTNKNEGGVPIEADKEYIFPLDDFRSCYILHAESMVDLNRIFVIFSKNSFNKPSLKENINYEILSEFEKQKHYITPDGLESEKFQDWLQKNKIFREDFQVEIIDITIKK
ncbi:MAG TPA: hypothetical protein PKN53_08180 [Bacteroidales bacterium]|nr:hypothetical protein [Bacteroidales bacterium]